MTDLEALCRRYASDVHRFSYWLSGNATEAEDLTSETFVRAWVGTGSIRVETAKAYLLTIARNLYLKRLRRLRRESELDPEIGRSAIRRTRGIVRRRSWFLAGTIFFCLMPASARLGPDGVSWLAKANPPLAVLFAAIGILLGTLYIAEGRRLRNTGL